MSKGREVKPAALGSEPGTIQGVIAKLREVARTSPDREFLEFAARQIEDMARRSRPKLDKHGGLDLAVSTLVSAQTLEAKIELAVGETLVQVPTAAAQAYALEILQAVSDAETEAAMFKTLTRFGIEQETIGRLVMELRAMRQARAAKGVTSA